MTNFLRLGTRRSALLDECFNEVYDNNLKGQAFEEACRKTLRENGIKTISKRVDITEPILPAEVSIALWGRQKSRTDIDVLACFNNNVLIIECKENKFKLPSISEKNQFKKYLIEHFHRVKWISSNLKKFENYVGLEEWLSLAITDNQPLYLFPLLVSSTFVETDEFKAAPLLTFIELKELVSKEWAAKTKGKTGELNIEIGPRVIKLPWFSVTDAKLISS
jgi:Holliday junction resolvase